MSSPRRTEYLESHLKTVGRSTSNSTSSDLSLLKSNSAIELQQADGDAGDVDDNKPKFYLRHSDAPEFRENSLDNEVLTKPTSKRCTYP